MKTLGPHTISGTPSDAHSKPRDFEDDGSAVKRQKQDYAIATTGSLGHLSSPTRRVDRGLPPRQTLHTIPDPLHRQRSAARDVFNLVEIRREILGFLSLSELARFMRVNQGTMRDVAEGMYREVTYDFAESIKSSDPIRQHIYCSSVQHIDARQMNIPDSIRQTPEWCRELGRGNTGCKYSIRLCHPKIVNILLPDLRRRFTSLRSLLIGELAPPWNDGTPACAIQLSRAADEGPAATVLARQSGCLTMYTTQIITLLACHPTVIVPPVAPTGDFVVRHRFNLVLGTSESGDANQRLERAADPVICRKWLLAIRDNSTLDDLYRKLVIHQIPLSIDDLTSLYTKQAALGYTQRLEEITVSQLEPWDMHQFRSFASVASSLTELVLGQYDGRGRLGDRTPLSFSYLELPTVTSIIRASLPKLAKFHFGMATSLGVEEDCLKLLTEESLEVGGTIEDLHIYAQVDVDASYYTWALNMVRVVYGMCSPNAEIDLGWDGKEYESYQSAFLKYLRRQPDRSRKALATVDFSLLNVNSYLEVPELGYDSSGQPQPRYPQTHPKPLTTAWFAKEGLRDRDLFGTVQQLDKMVAAPAVEKLRVAEGVLHMVDEAVGLVEGVDGVAIRAYVEQLRIEVALRG